MFCDHDGVGEPFIISVYRASEDSVYYLLNHAVVAVASVEIVAEFARQ
jgi:hypothetical protein